MPRIVEPKDKTRREHIGTVERLVYVSDDRSFCIITLTDELTVLGPGDPDHFTRGSTWRFLGRWEDSADRGPRFKFSTYVVHHLHNRAGIVKYLTLTCEGVGEKTADKLFFKYGSDAVSILREDPARVARELKLSEEVCENAALDLDRAKRFEATRVDLFGLFAGKGFTGHLIERAIEKWGVKAPAVVRRNPFALLGLPSAGFRRCDRLWTELGLPRDALKRAAMCAVNAIKNDSQGHTWLEASELANKLRELIPAVDAKRAFRFAKRARLVKVRRDDAGRTWLATYHNALAEERIAASVHRLSRSPNLWPADRVTPGPDGKPSEHQVERLRLACAGPVGLLLGGPGTGKTTSLGYLLREVIADYGVSSICVAAPTGKAAVRATQALALAGLDIQARTIHSTLQIGRNGHDGDGWGFQFNAGNPLPYRFVITDETSMCDVGLMADLLDACGTGTHVLMIGDAGQLPPVGNGAPLRDFIEAGLPRGELTQIRRNAGQIVHACARIRGGETFETTETVDLDATPPRNLKLIDARDEAEAVDVLCRVLASAKKFNPVWQTQVIVARNTKGELSRTKLNARLHPMLNPDGWGIEGNPFKVGDKIICLRNSRMHRVEPIGQFHEGYAEEMARDAGNYQTVFLPDDDDPDGDDDFGGGQPRRGREPEEVYIANGEIGRVVAVGKSLTIARFSEGEMLVKIPMGKGKDRDQDEDEGGEGGGGDGEKGRGCNFDHAYAVTGHRMQGSESPCVIIMGDEQGGLIASREWIYTAISRASKLCILIGKMSTFDKMKNRVALHRRKTFLAEMVREVMAQ